MQHTDAAPHWCSTRMFTPMQRLIGHTHFPSNGTLSRPLLVTLVQLRILSIGWMEDAAIKQGVANQEQPLLRLLLRLLLLLRPLLRLLLRLLLLLRCFFFVFVFETGCVFTMMEKHIAHSHARLRHDIDWCENTSHALNYVWTPSSLEQVRDLHTAMAVFPGFPTLRLFHQHVFSVHIKYTKMKENR